MTSALVPHLCTLSLHCFIVFVCFHKNTCLCLVTNIKSKWNKNDLADMTPVSLLPQLKIACPLLEKMAIQEKKKKAQSTQELGEPFNTKHQILQAPDTKQWLQMQSDHHRRLQFPLSRSYLTFTFKNDTIYPSCGRCIYRIPCFIPWNESLLTDF